MTLQREENRIFKFRAWDIDKLEMNNDLDAPIKDGGIINMQFTGLYDKNNTPIYEGDIIKSNGGITAAIKWIDSNPKLTIGFFFDNEAGFTAPLTPSIGDILEIIGNIY